MDNTQQTTLDPAGLANEVNSAFEKLGFSTGAPSAQAAPTEATGEQPDSTEAPPVAPAATPVEKPEPSTPDDLFGGVFTEDAESTTDGQGSQKEPDAPKDVPPAISKLMAKAKELGFNELSNEFVDKLLAQPAASPMPLIGDTESKYIESGLITYEEAVKGESILNIDEAIKEAPEDFAREHLESLDYSQEEVDALIDGATEIEIRKWAKDRGDQLKKERRSVLDEIKSRREGDLAARREREVKEAEARNKFISSIEEVAKSASSLLPPGVKPDDDLPHKVSRVLLEPAAMKELLFGQGETPDVKRAAQIVASVLSMPALLKAAQAKGAAEGRRQMMAEAANAPQVSNSSGAPVTQALTKPGDREAIRQSVAEQFNKFFS